MPTLGKVGIVDKGNYSASATYNSGDFVTHNGSTFLAIKDGVKGIAPSDDKTNWKYLAKGFNEPAASGITVTDTHGIIDGSKGKKTFAQNLFDGIGNWIITKAVTNDTFVNKLTERLINNGTATQTGFALDARQGNPTVEGSLAKQISKLNEETRYYCSYVRDFHSSGGPFLGFNSNNWNPGIYINPNSNKLYLRYTDNQAKTQTIEYSLTRVKA